MERKLGNKVAVAAEDLKAALSKSSGLTAEEEKVLRLRHGVAVDLRAPLASASAQRANLADELLLLEMELARAYRQRVSPRAVARPAANVSADDRAKSKIIRGLRKKR